MVTVPIVRIPRVRKLVVTMSTASRMLIIENREHMVAELSVLELSLQDSLFSMILLRSSNHRLHSDSLNLSKLGLVLANFWWVSLARVALLPSVPTGGVET